MTRTEGWILDFHVQEPKQETRQELITVSFAKKIARWFGKEADEQKVEQKAECERIKNTLLSACFTQTPTGRRAIKDFLILFTSIPHKAIRFRSCSKALNVQHRTLSWSRRFGFLPLDSCSILEK